MTEINPRIASSQAEQIAKNLDAKDGKEDGKISASIWNEYAETTGGNKIKNCIMLDNAIKSITTYIKRGSESLSNFIEGKSSSNNVVASGVVSDLLSDEHKEIGEPKTPEEEYWANRPLNYVTTEHVNKPLSTEEIEKRKGEAKECVDSFVSWLRGECEYTKPINKNNAAYFVEEYLSRGYKLNANPHTNIMLPTIMESLIERATELGIKTEYANKDLGKVHFDELADAIKFLSWNITAVEEMGSGPSVWADENK